MSTPHYGGSASAAINGAIAAHGTSGGENFDAALQAMGWVALAILVLGLVFVINEWGRKR